MNNYTIYMHVVPNGKKYIGITNQEPEKRWNRGSGYTSNSEFHADIKKYGWANIKHQIIKKYLSKEEAEFWEVEMIARYRTTDPKHGYNFTRGGMHHGEISERTRKKLSEHANSANKEACICLETKRKYQSMASAARKYNTNRKAVYRSCASDGKKAANGKHFIYADPEKRQNATRNEVLKESQEWNWEW